jgi:tellurite resistance protein TerC
VSDAVRKALAQMALEPDWPPGEAISEGRTFEAVGVNPYRRAIFFTVLAIVAAHIFAVLIYFGLIPMAPSGSEAAMAFYSCFLVEKSLSLDNLFAFYLVFRYFKVGTVAQNRCLHWGIIGATLLRAFMVCVGSIAVARMHWVLLIFAAILVYSGA